MPFRHFGRGELHHVGDDAHRGTWREYIFFLRLVFLENIVLNRASKLRTLDAGVLTHGDVHGHDHRGRAIDGHGGRHRTEVNVSEKVFHVGQRVHGYATVSDFAKGPVVIAVAAHKCWHVERCGQTTATRSKQFFEASVGVFSRSEASEHAHRPQAGSIASCVQPARVGILAGVRALAVQRIDGYARHCFERNVAQLGRVVCLLPCSSGLVRCRIAHGFSK